MKLIKILSTIVLFLILTSNTAQSAGLDVVKFDDNFVWFKPKADKRYNRVWFDRSKEPIQSDAKHFLMLPKALCSYLGFQDGEGVIRIPRVDYLIAQLKAIGVDAFSIQ